MSKESGAIISYDELRKIWPGPGLASKLQDYFPKSASQMQHNFQAEQSFVEKFSFQKEIKKAVENRLLRKV